MAIVKSPRGGARIGRDGCACAQAKRELIGSPAALGQMQKSTARRVH
jgi:hypothetical protein